VWSGIILFSSKQNFHDPESKTQTCWFVAILSADKIWLRLAQTKNLAQANQLIRGLAEN